MDVLELTRELVAIDSQNPGKGEQQIAHWVADWCRQRDFDVRLIEYEDGRPNVLVTVDKGKGRHLGLSGHLDTKPVGDAISSWNTDPFTLTINGDTAFGLGATDMKGAVAAMLVALERFSNSSLSGSLSLILTADEEQGSDAGAQMLSRSNDLPEIDALVIGEPSGIKEPWESLHLVSRGICCFHVHIETIQGHSGLSPALGRNAVLIAADLLRAFETFVPPVASPGRVLSEPTVNSGIMIDGGVCFGVWPGQATVSIEIRTIPGMEKEQVQQAVDDLVQHTVSNQATATVDYEEGSMGWMPAVELDPNHSIVAAANKAAALVLGSPLPLAAFPGGTDAAYFMGEKGIPTVVSLGPGWISVAHGANEKVGVSQLYQSVDIYSELVKNYLTTDVADHR
ncbi:M20 family metallopeptidase [Arthrobacter pigmenti]